MNCCDVAPEIVMSLMSLASSQLVACLARCLASSTLPCLFLPNSLSLSFLSLGSSPEQSPRAPDDHDGQPQRCRSLEMGMAVAVALTLGLTYIYR